MSTEIITNEQKTLSEVINKIMPSADKLFFLVGYFYFSGFREIYENIADKEVKILVGLDVEKDIANRVSEVARLHNNDTSNAKVRREYFKSLTAVFNDTDYFDTAERENAFRLFMNKIVDGSLEIRKTRVSEHSKIYLFENKKEFSQGGEFPGTVIFGSSNLTYSGLTGQGETNVLMRDSGNYNSMKQKFMHLWENAVEIVNKNNVDEFTESVINKIWIDKLPDPYLIYIRVLQEYLAFSKNEKLKLPSEITKSRFSNLKYQIDAIQQAIDIINKHNGVIIADVVGLGKSIVGSTIAHNMGLDTVIIAPPHLAKQWDDYRFDFKFNARVYSSGSIEQALKENKGGDTRLIIIDEAHKYRNEETVDYALLHRLCQGNKVVLLTATPFNNDPKDIFAMIKLFQIPAKSTIQTVDSLSIRFKVLIKEYKDIKKSQKEHKQEEEVIKQRIKKLAEQIRDLLAPLLIRRSRLDLQAIKSYRDDLEKQHIAFPKVNPPEILDYDLGDLGPLYMDTLLKIAPDNPKEGFRGARYKPTNYLRDDSAYKKQIQKEFKGTKSLQTAQSNLAQFMKRLLVHRFESSIDAFRKTLDNMIHSSEQIKEWHEKGIVPIYKKGNLPDIETLFDLTGDELIEELDDLNSEEKLQRYLESGLEIIKRDELQESFIKDLENDISLLKEIRDQWFSSGPIRDPKVEHFKTIIKEKLTENENRKVVVFTEYSDTADYVYEQLKNEFRVFKYSAADATKQNKETIKENFDAGYPTQKDEYDILVATDAISEGYNLHRAGIVFNYDISYNPTRVIQRVGRINRINKKVFDELFIYNFFPTSTGEIETRVKQITTLKLAVIQVLLGEDTMVLTSDEELQSFYTEEFLNSLEQDEELSWDAYYKNLLDTLKANNPEIIEQSMNLPKRTRIRRAEKKDQSGVIVFGRKGKDYAFKLGITDKECQSITAAGAIKLFEATTDENAEAVGSSFHDIYENAKKNLFARKTEVAKDKGLGDALHKIEELITRLPDKKDYFKDLKYVLEELDALPDRAAKKIRAISIETLDEDVSALMQEVPHSYLMEIRETAERIDEGEESLILAEELV